MLERHGRDRRGRGEGLSRFHHRQLSRVSPRYFPSRKVDDKRTSARGEGERAAGYRDKLQFRKFERVLPAKTRRREDAKTRRCASASDKGRGETGHLAEMRIMSIDRPFSGRRGDFRFRIHLRRASWRVHGVIRRRREACRRNHVGDDFPADGSSWRYYATRETIGRRVAYRHSRRVIRVSGRKRDERLIHDGLAIIALPIVGSVCRGKYRPIR